MTSNTIRASMVALLAAGAACGTASADFIYNNFASTGGLTLVGSASQNASRIMVTPSASGQAGAVWHAIKDEVANGFDTTMVIHVEGKNGGGSDGLAFVIQNQAANAIGASGLGIGYGRSDPFNIAGIANSFAMELDMWNNSDGTFFDQGGDNHVAFQSRGLLQNVTDNTGTLAAAATSDLSDGSNHTVRLRYSGGFMDAFVDGVQKLHTAVNLSTLLNLDTSGNGVGKAWIGITASTGGAANKEAHIVDSWSFTTTPIPAPSSVALLGLGGLVAARRKR